MTTETQTATEQPEAPESTLEDRIAEQFSYGSEEADVSEETTVESATDEQAEEGAEEQQAQEPALEDVEFEGETYKLPPKIKSALMAQSDYTRKTQEVADQRRMLDHQILMQQQETQFSQSVAPELQQLQMLDSQLAQYRQVDWTALTTEQQTQYQLAVNKLKDDKQELVQALHQKRGQFDQQMQGLMRQAAEKGNEYLKRHIPSWGQDVQKELATYGQAEGYSDVELAMLTDARMIKSLWKAQQWDKLQSQKATSTKRAEQAPPVLKPGASTKTSAQQQNDAAYRKAIKAAKGHTERDRIVQKRLEQKLFGP